MNPIPNSVHVCSLQTSAIKKIAQQAVEEAENGDMVTAYRLKWLNVAMEYNRQKQMQYVFANLGSKGKSPAFRAIRMRPFWHMWRKESLRIDWNEIRENIDRKMMIQDLSETTRYFESQRIELACRAFAQSPAILQLPLADIVNSKKVKELYTFQTPGSVRPGYYNQGYNYVESAALSTFSDVSDSEPQTESVDPWDRPLEEEFVELAEERGFIEQQKQAEQKVEDRDVPIDEPEEKVENKSENIQNEQVEKKEEPIEKSAKPQSSKKKNVLYIIIALIAIAILCAASFIAYKQFYVAQAPPAEPKPVSNK